MALADRILELRRDRGWSQEDLAARLGVSRQSVSKWESGASQPEIDKVVALSRLFGVSTDSLLLDDQLPAISVPESDTAAVADLRETMAIRGQCAREIARGVALCVASPAPLMMLEAIDRPWAEAVGVVVLLELVALAVYLFIVNGMRLNTCRAMEKAAFEAGAGEMAEIERRRLTPAFRQSVAFGVGLCVASPVPVILADIMDAGDGMLAFTCGLLLLVVAAGTYLFVRGGVVIGGLKRLSGKNN